ncbi:hypothetical protein B9Z51_02585 [Limnohabitans sp. T6-5]|uniref:helix-turn-helix transcriptional regulator n=1 Tax=Limnohabitans sp. T6-5 TaxID=1100724 RepID=UPI000D364E47|nr:AlpA family transcriptional regulator [Limnohabitans sp. T6-5]PUE11215.1 hypothetical protein B9Z51_02585 [Limnohabitans sp. T6-5]
MPANRLFAVITFKFTFYDIAPVCTHAGLCNFLGNALNQKTPLNTPAPGRLLRLDAVENLTGLRKSSIYTYMGSKSHGFPTPVRIGARAVAWRESDVLAWIAGRTEARPQGGDK